MNEKINEIVNKMSHTETNCFAYEGGKYEINIGKSSRDIILTGSVDIKGDGKEELLIDKYSKLDSYNNLKIPFVAKRDR